MESPCGGWAREEQKIINSDGSDYGWSGLTCTDPMQTARSRGDDVAPPEREHLRAEVSQAA